MTIPSTSALGYFNVPKSQRNGASKEISIKDVEKHIKQIHDDVLAFLDSFGNHFVKIINQDCRVSQVCLIDNGLIGARLISLKEYLSNEQGICQTTAFDCPKKAERPARRKAQQSS